GMSGIISQAKLQKLLDKNVEPDFAEGNYAAAAENFYYEVIELLEEHFSISTDEGDFLLYKQQLEEERLKAEKERKYTFYAFAAVGAVTLLLFVRFVIILIVSLRRRARQKRRLF
ncbi:MAG: TPM domain-containing protein, partial [Oscillospiraceae bacterium]|nr:TPM domain-containing protein [Oscillospiraceae bacterium]